MMPRWPCFSRPQDDAILEMHYSSPPPMPIPAGPQDAYYCRRRACTPSHFELIRLISFNIICSWSRVEFQIRHDFFMGICHTSSHRRECARSI